MLKINNLILPVKYTEQDVTEQIIKTLKIGSYDIISVRVLRDSVDAHRRGSIVRCISAAVSLRGEKRFIGMKNVEKYKPYCYEYPAASRLKLRPVIVGSGPAGLFCALILASCGAQPIVLERGSDVDTRVKKVSSFFKNGILDPKCNIQFGEGGAGTFSDGKLNTGTRDPRQKKVLEEFVRHGAPEDILTNAKPHIGTDMLIETVKNIRKEIIALGGEVMFDTLLKDIDIENGAVSGVFTDNGYIKTDTVILAAGHSARDTFKMLYSHNVLMSKKAFSVGVRIEHPQKLINDAMYHTQSPDLPPADYKTAVHLKDGRGIYTFCMCPGGSVVAAASEPETVVTNGMSNHMRDGKNANSALLVSVLPSDFSDNDIFAGMRFQKKLEKAAFFLGGASYRAPVQTVSDFLRGQKSISLGNVEPTYPIGVTPSDLGKLFPLFITNSLKEGIVLIDRKIHSFALPDAVLTAVESRSSSPVRIVRGENLQSNIRGLYPCGEGAGYAGGIMSAAVDGIRVAEKILGK